MGSRGEQSKKNAVTIEKEERFFLNRDARLRDQEHFEMAFEWLKSRGKIAHLESLSESV